jgi:hypothetical protein
MLATQPEAAVIQYIDRFSVADVAPSSHSNCEEFNRRVGWICFGRPLSAHFRYQDVGNAQATGMDAEFSGRATNDLQEKASFDHVEFDPGRPEDPEDAIQQDGRSFRIKVTARF